MALCCYLNTACSTGADSLQGSATQISRHLDIRDMDCVAFGAHLWHRQTLQRTPPDCPHLQQGQAVCTHSA